MNTLAPTAVQRWMVMGADNNRNDSKRARHSTVKVAARLDFAKGKVMGMREKLIELANDVLNYLPWGEISSHTAKEIADHLIAHGVTIPVRCKDCKHRGDYGCPMYHEEYIEWDDDGYPESEIIDHDRTRDDGFCDLGERRTDDCN